MHLSFLFRLIHIQTYNHLVYHYTRLSFTFVTTRCEITYICFQNNTRLCVGKSTLPLWWVEDYEMYAGDPFSKTCFDGVFFVSCISGMQTMECSINGMVVVIYEYEGSYFKIKTSKTSPLHFPQTTPIFFCFNTWLLTSGFYFYHSLRT